MYRTTYLGAIATLSLGGLLGYVAASANLTSTDPAKASGAVPMRTQNSPACSHDSRGGHGDLADRSRTSSSKMSQLVAEDFARPACCTEGLNKGGLLALAMNNQNVTSQVDNSGKKPNILVIFGDDIGTWNVGVYTHGMMGRTPSIDRIASEGILFTDHYAQPSCTAGRAAFIMGQMPIRTGMTTIGIPGSARGIQKVDPTLAEVLKTQGYSTS